MVESVAIMQYLMARHGPTPLAPEPHDPAFPAYLQFLHLGEAGLAMPMYFNVITRNLAPEAERDNWTAREGVAIFANRLGLVTRQLARSPYLAGATFTAADIAVTYSLEFAQRNGYALGEIELSYLARITARPAYKRAMDACHDTRAWAEAAAARRKAVGGAAK
jgi:glutathione S-transferase